MKSKGAYIFLALLLLSFSLTYLTLDIRKPIIGQYLLQDTTDYDKRWFASIHHLDPIFALPGTDLSNARKALEPLKKQREWLAQNIYLETGSANVMYPIELLESFLALEDARRTVIFQPTKKTIGEYQEQTNYFFGLYFKYIEDLREVYETLRRKSPEKDSFSFFNGTSDVGYFGEALSSLEETAVQKREELSRRYSCYKGNAYDCRLTKRIPLAKTSLLPTKTNVRLSEVESSFARILENITVQLPDTERGPIFITNSGSCLTERGENLALIPYWKRDSHYALELFPLKDFGLYRTEEHPIPGIARLAEEGVELIHQPLLNLYMCPENIGTLAQATSMLAVAKRQNQQESIILTQGSLLAFQLKELHEKEGELRMQEEEFAEGLLAHTAGFDWMLHSVVFNNRAIPVIAKSGWSFDDLSLYLSRGYPFLYLQAYNQTVTSKPPTLSSPIPLAFKHFGMLPYSSYMRASLDEKDVADVIVTARKHQPEIYEEEYVY